MTIRRGAAAKYHSARLTWARAHQSLFDCIPGIDEDVDEATSAHLDTLRRQMVAAGLFGGGVPRFGSQRETIRRLADELRGRRRVVAW